MIPQCAQAKPAVTGPHTDHSQAVSSMTVAGVSISPPMPSVSMPSPAQLLRYWQIIASHHQNITHGKLNLSYFCHLLVGMLVKLSFPAPFQNNIHDHCEILQITWLSHNCNCYNKIFKKN